MSDAGAAFKRLLEVLNQVGIPYAVGGSLASSVHGTPRATADIHLVVDIRPVHAGSLATALDDDFFADEEMIAGSIEAGRAFNIIHYASGYKFDLFPLPDEPYYRVEFERREPARVYGRRTAGAVRRCYRRGRHPRQAGLVPIGRGGLGEALERCQVHRSGSG